MIECLKQQTNSLDSLAVKLQTITQKLQEYRTALISAAVMDKIDVRGRSNP
jgi:hypothetical protein